MKTHIITKDQLDADNNYVGAVALIDFDGSLEIGAHLGCVKFSTRLRVTGSIFAKAGSGIEAGWGIEAGSGIEAGEGISVTLRVFAGLCMWRLPSEEEQTVRCKEFRGTLAFGKLIETKDSPASL